MTYGQKERKKALDEELRKYNQLMKKLGRPSVSLSTPKRKTHLNKTTKIMPSAADWRKPNLPSTSDKILVSGKKHDIFMIMNDGSESLQTIEAIKTKANSTAPLYSKGAYQYITPKTNTTEIGKKL